VKKYWDRASEPSLIRIKAHTQYVAKYHRAQVDPAKYPKFIGKPPTHFGEVPLTSIKVEADLTKEKDDQELARQKFRIGQKT
jgi:hypothetical protein